MLTSGARERDLSSTVRRCVTSPSLIVIANVNDICLYLKINRNMLLTNDDNSFLNFMSRNFYTTFCLLFSVSPTVSDKKTPTDRRTTIPMRANDVVGAKLLCHFPLWKCVKFNYKWPQSMRSDDPHRNSCPFEQYRRHYRPMSRYLCDCVQKRRKIIGGELKKNL